MRGLFAALTKLTVADHFGFSGNVLGKYPNNRSTNCRLFVEKARGSLFDLFSQSEKLLHARGAFCSLRSSEFIKRGIADLTHENLVVVQHGKPESVSFLVMPLDFVTDQRHGPHSPQTGAGSQRMPRPASQINGFTATLSRKLLLSPWLRLLLGCARRHRPRCLYRAAVAAVHGLRRGRHHLDAC